MLDTRQRNVGLEMTIMQTLTEGTLRSARNVVVVARSDGTVWLRGWVASRNDCTRIKEAVEKVPGVTHVFCNVAPRSST